MNSNLAAIFVAGIFTAAAAAAYTVTRLVQRRGRHVKPLSFEDKAALAWVRGLRPEPGWLAVQLRSAQAALGGLLEQAARAKVAPDPNAHVASRWSDPAGLTTATEEGAK